MLYLVFTVDGDWKEYFDIKLSDEERMPREGILQDLIQREIDVADRNLNGRFIHFIHTSPRIRDFFLEKAFRRLWKDIIKNGGDIGLHCHEDIPYKDYYYQDSKWMKRVISERMSAFRKSGLDLGCYRSGFLGFSSEMVRILEDNNIYFDFSCEPGRFLTHGKYLISDWRGAPQRHYRMSYDNHCKIGNSKVWEIPIGTSRDKFFYFEKSSLENLEKVAFDLKQKSIENKCDIVVSVLTHSYEYASLEQIKNIEEKLSLLKKYSSFINLEDLKKVIT